MAHRDYHLVACGQQFSLILALGFRKMSSAEDLSQMAFGGSSDAAIDLEQADHIQAIVVESGVP